MSIKYIDGLIFIVIILLISAARFYFGITRIVSNRDKVNESWKFLRELELKLGIQLKIPKRGFFTNRFPNFTGQTIHETFSFQTVNTTTGNFTNSYTKIRIDCLKIPGFRFSISKENSLMKVAKKILAPDIEMNQEKFDKLFMVTSSDEEKLRKILSTDSCWLLASYGNWLSPEINFENGILKYKETGIVSSKEDVERIYSILLMLFDLCVKMRELKKNND